MNSDNPLSQEEAHIIEDKGTEAPFTGKYNDFDAPGLYTCKRCDAPLYRSQHKFISQCGWPSFDDELPGAIKRLPDADGRRTEILCHLCDAHLGHVFEGEFLTEKNLRHCVNSLSMNFVASDKADDQALQNAYFAGGCFWGVEHLLRQIPGVVDVVSGYMGGHTKNPNYREVCSGASGHIETVEVLYRADQTDFETLAKAFFEIHDPGQENGQGPDIGHQYISVVFYRSLEEKRITETLIAQLKDNGHKVVTRLIAADTFWIAEDDHQQYYSKTGKEPYCHRYEKKFNR